MYSFKDITTFKVGGSIEQILCPETTQEFVSCVSRLSEEKTRFMIVGGGSNILASDEHFDGTVVTPHTKNIIFERSADSILVIADAGVEWDALVEKTIVSESVWGLENLSGIPGMVGAAPVQNIGAYGADVSETVAWVEVYDTKQKTIKLLENKDLEFEYRSSVLKKEHPRFVILRVAFLLKKNGKPNISYKDLNNFFTNKVPTLEEVRNAVLEIRSGKFPDLNEYGTAGSFFMNPIITRSHKDTLVLTYPELPYFQVEKGFKVSLSWILDHVVNAKGMSVENAFVWNAQPLVITTNKNATAAHVRALQKEIQKKIFQKTNIKIIPEVLIL